MLFLEKKSNKISPQGEKNKLGKFKKKIPAPQERRKERLIKSEYVKPFFNMPY